MARNTIIIEWPVSTGPKQKEALAAAAGIIPGNLIERVAGGVQNSNNASTAFSQKLFAVEDPIGVTAGTAQIDKAYASGDTVRFVAPLPGTVINARIADAQTMVIGGPLASNADGTLVVLTPAGTDIDNNIVAVSLEAKTTAVAGERAQVEVV